MHEPIAVIGMGCRFPGGANNPEQFWEMLKTGKCAATTVPPDRWSVDDYYHPEKGASGKMITKKAAFLNTAIKEFDADFFAISPNEAEYLDPQQRLVLEVVHESLENAGIATTSLKGTNTGVYLGWNRNDFQEMLTASNREEHLQIYSGTGSAPSILAGRVSFIYGLEGPSYAIDSACSASLSVIDLACQDLRKKVTDLTVVGGVNLILTPTISISFSSAGMLSPDGLSKTFDASADGYGRGEGCGIVILKRLSDAIADNDNVLAVVRASGINQAGMRNGLTAPTATLQTELIKQVCHSQKITLTDIDFVETHGTGTELGDPIEVRGLANSYGLSRDKKHPLMLGSVKTNIGHLEGAAGISGFIKTVLSLHHEMIPPLLHFQTLNPEIDLSFPAKIVSELTPWKRSDHKRMAAVSSFGFSGANAHVVLEEAPKLDSKPIKEDKHEQHIVTLSAKTKNALDSMVKDYIAYLEHTAHRIEDIAYTSNSGRDHYDYRIAVMALDVEDLRKKLLSNSYKKTPSTELEKTSSKIDIDKNQLDKEDYLNSLAEQYVAGVDINWSNFEFLYHPNSHKVSIPTYPFQRKEYWPDVSKPEFGYKRRSVHPLLGEQKNMPNGDVYFSAEINLNELPYLRDHQVYDNIVYPAAGYFEIMLAAVKYGLGKDVFSLEDVSLERAMNFERGDSIELLIVLTTEDGMCEITIYSKIQDESEDRSAWRSHAKGLLKIDKEVNKPEFTDISNLRSRLDRKITGSEFYDQINASGLYYGKAFQVLKKIDLNIDEALGELELSVSPKGYIVHPALLDSCLQMASVLLQASDRSHADGKVALPIGCDVIHIYEPLEDRLIAHWKQMSADEKGVSGNFQLLNESGELLAKIEGMQYRYTTESALRKMLAYERGLTSFDKVKSIDLLDQLKSAPLDQQYQILYSFVEENVKQVLGFSRAETIEKNKGFFDMGLDSMMAVALKDRLQDAVGKSIVISSAIVFNYSTVVKLVNNLCDIIGVQGVKPEESKAEQLTSRDRKKLAIEESIEKADELEILASLAKELEGDSDER